MKVETLVLPESATDVHFGIQVKDFDLETDFDQLSDLVAEKLVVVVRDQSKLSPKDQYLLTKRFDPASETYGHGHDKKSTQLLEKSILQSDLISIPHTPQVKLLGNGRVKNHEGIAIANLKHPQHHTFHKTLLSQEEESEGYTRFFRWHIDAALYATNPPRVTTLLGLKVPDGRRHTIRYDDGSNDFIPDVCLGATAFASGEKAYAILSDKQKEFALNTWIQYAPHPYIWIKNAKSLSNGLGMETDHLELPWDQLPPYQDEALCVLPMVWKNRQTGRFSLQIHPSCAHGLITRGSSVTDLKEVRNTLYQLMRPGIAPNRVYTHEWREGDLVIFNNQSVWHTVTGTLRAEEARIFHQCNLVGSEPPLPGRAMAHV